MSAPTFLSLLNAQTYSAAGTAVPDGSITTISSNKQIWGTTFPSSLYYSTLTGSTMSSRSIAFSTMSGSTLSTNTLSLSATSVALGQSTNQTAGANLSNGTYNNWITAKTGMTNVKKVAMSSTGQYQLIVVDTALWLSSDSGQTWTQPTATGLPSGSFYIYSSGAISADGTYITIAVYGYALYVSSDSASTFTQVYPVSPTIWMKLDGNTTDTMGATTVTTAGTMTYVSGPITGQALSLTNPNVASISNYVRGTCSLSTSFTASGWFSLSSFPTSGNAAFIWAFTGPSNIVAWLMYRNDTAYGPASGVYFTFYNSNSTTIVVGYKTNIQLNTWYHATFIYSSTGRCYAYINGVLVGSVVGSPLLVNINEWGLGGTSGTSGTSYYGLNGSVDDFRLYNSIVDPSYISTAMSGSGQYQLVGTDYGQIFQSSTYGTTWSLSTGATSTGCVKSLALSHSGQHQMVNSQKWVSPNQTGLTTTSATINSITYYSWYQAGVNWTVGASSVYYPIDRAFNNVLNSTWASDVSVYNGSGTYIGSKSTTVQGGIGSLAGEWFQIQSSVPLVLSSYTYGSGGPINQTMKTYWIVGSNDNGTTWYPIHQATMTSTPFTTTYALLSNNIAVNYTGTQAVSSGQTGSCTTTSYPTTTNAYTYFRVIVRENYGGTLCEVNEFVPNFLAANTYTPQQKGLAAATWSVNGVVYTASASSLGYGGAYPAYNSFNNNSGNGNSFYTATNYNSSGVYTGVASTPILGGVGTQTGEWLQLQSSVPFVLSSYTFGAAGYTGFSKTFYIVGSNDGSTWYPLQYGSITNSPFTDNFQICKNYIQINSSGVQPITAGQVGSITTTSYSTSTNAYTYFRFIVPSLFGTGSTSGFDLGEWYINFLGGQSYSTNSGATWSVVPNTNYSAPQSMSSSGQYQLAVSNSTMLSRLTLDNTAGDSQGGVTYSAGAPSSYSSSIYKVGTHSALFSNTAGGSPSVYLNYTVPTVINQPSALTMMCWVYPTSLATNCMPISLNTGSTSWGNYFYFNSSGTIVFSWASTANTAGTNIVTTSTISANTWWHLAMTYGSGTMTVYLNGAVIATSSVTGNLCMVGGGNLTNLLVGTGVSNNGAFAGYIDDVRLYTSALTSNQVAALYADPSSTQFLAISSGYPTGLSSTPTGFATLTGVNGTAIVDTAQSFNGQTMVAITAATTGNNVYYSTNYGVTWTGISVGTATAPLVSCAVSGNGSYLIVTSSTATYTLNNNGSGFTLAIGSQAGAVAQGANAIAIGNKAGQVNQAASSIVLNASGSTVNASASGFYVAPIATAYGSATTGITLLGYGADQQIVQTNNMTFYPSSGAFATYGNVMIGPTTSEPHGLLQFANTLSNRKITLWEDGDNDHQNYGFGINPYILRYQVGLTSANHVFYAASSSTTSNELMRIQGNGNVGIGTTSPGYRLDISGPNNSVIFRVRGPINGSNGFDQALNISTSDGGGPYSSYSAIQASYEGSSNNYLSLNPLGGNVGIGTTNPGTKLWIVPGISSTTLEGTAQWGGIHLQPNGTNDTINGITFGANGNGYETQVEAGIICKSANTYGTKLYFQTTNDYSAGAKNRMMIDHAGNVGIGTISPLMKLHVYGGGSSNSGFCVENIAASNVNAKAILNGRGCATLMQSIDGSSSMLYFYASNAVGTPYMYNLSMYALFTGQHVNEPVNPLLKSNLNECVGLIVSSDGTYCSRDPYTKEYITGKNAITITESLPRIKLTTKDKDKAVWGVITNVKNQNYKQGGGLVYDDDPDWDMDLGTGVRVNGLGEGAIWVTNINGPLENGDYICSSTIPGYGRRQEDDLLHNYTVAKITMDCTFDLNTTTYRCEEFVYNSVTYRRAFVGCTYHCS